MQSSRIALLVTALCLSSSPMRADIYLRTGVVVAGDEARAQGDETGAVGVGRYLVQLDGPITPERRAAVLSAGARIENYLPEFAYLVSIDRSRLADLKRLRFIAWVGEYRRVVKTAAASDDSRPRQYLITSFPGVSVDYLRARLKSLGFRVIECANGPAGAVCKVLCSGEPASRLSTLASVAWIEPYEPPRLCNDVASSISGLPDVKQRVGLFGAGEIVGAADAGLDTGDLSTISPDFAGRIRKTYALRRPDDWSCLNGHGTHTMGSFVGSGAMSGSNPAAHSYAGSFAGYAPEAELVFQSIGDGGALVFPPLYLSELFQPVYDDGVRVHSDSWGSSAAGAYTVYSNQVDLFCWEHKDFLPVFAVGNEAEDINQDGIADRDNIYSPSTAKNCLSVGATENLRSQGGLFQGYGVAWPESYPASPIKYDLVSNNANGLAAFSGRGPTDDGRVKPDICAPGTNIISCRTHTTRSMTGWGVYDSDYIYWGGTSMSCPQVAGAAALAREYFRKEKGILPSAALIKAALICGAIDLSPGQYGTGPLREVYPAPDPSQGWGRLNLKNSVCPDAPRVNEFVDESSGLTTAACREHQFTVVNTSVPLRATLVWTDYPGAVQAARELVNDLDLTVISPSGVAYPDGSARDRLNNVEVISIPQPEPGTYRVRVEGYNVPMGPQDYALVVTGGLPSAFISGKVLSASGAGVPGALVTFVSSSGVKRVTTNACGLFSSHLAPATYQIQVTKPGWSFEPRSRIIQLASVPVESADFAGTGSPGSASGTVTGAVGGVVSSVVESSHPYLNNTDRTWSVSGHSGVGRIRVHFAEIDLMNDGDQIQISDTAGHVTDTFAGKGEDVWSSWVDGAELRVRLLTNSVGNIGYGFYIDGYETDLIPQGPVGGVLLALAPGAYSTTANADGTWRLDSIPPGNYSVTPSRPKWKFQPVAMDVEIPAGSEADGIDFLGFPPGRISGEVRATSVSSRALAIASKHPYANGTLETWEVDGGPECDRIRLHFSRISTEPAWDYVYVTDTDDNIAEIYTAESSDVWTPWIGGRLARVTLEADDGNPAWGFECDSCEVETSGEGLSGVRVELLPDGRGVLSDSAGRFVLDDVAVGSHTAIPSLIPWTFDPSVCVVNVSSGLAESIFFHARIDEINRVSHAMFVRDGLRVTLRRVTVSGVFGRFFYVQDDDRLCGLRVDWNSSVSEGTVVDIAGVMGTVDGERRIAASSVTPSQGD